MSRRVLGVLLLVLAGLLTISAYSDWQRYQKLKAKQQTEEMSK